MTSRTYTGGFELPRPVDRVFPLFSPEGEKLWAPGWDYQNIMGTTDLSEDYAFLTRTHDHASTEAVWLVKRYEPESHHIQYYKVEPEDKVGVVTVDCSSRPEGSTRVQVTYKYIALSDTGSRFLETFTEENYEAFLREWGSLLLKYLGKEKAQ